MKYFFSIIAISILLSCRKDKTESPPPPSAFRPAYLDYSYSAMVKINGNTELKYLKADKLIYDSVPSRLALEFVNSDSAFNFYYPITISVNRCATGTYRLRSLGAIIDISPISVDKLCCYTNPDQSYWNYVTYEPDSLDNYIKLTVDSINNTAYGLFKATLIPFNGLPSDGPDTIRLSCDTFYCKYSTIIH